MTRISKTLLLLVLAAFALGAAWIVSTRLDSSERDRGVKAAVSERSQPAPAQSNSRLIRQMPAPAGESRAMLKTFQALAKASRQRELAEFSAVKGDFHQAAKLAIAGNNLLARHLFAVRTNQVSERIDLPDSISAEVKASLLENRIPKDLPQDPLYWLRFAADRKDVLSQLDYARLAVTYETSNNSRTTEEVAAINARAVDYLRELVAQKSVADAYALLSYAYRDGKLGFQADPIKAHACMLLLNRLHPTAETQQLARFSEQPLRVGEREQAISMAESPAFMCEGH